MNTTVIKEKFKTAFNAVSRFAIIIAAMVIGFTSSQLYTYVKNKDRQEVGSTMPVPKSMEVTSIAINERGELMVIDRSNGNYQIYSDSVGQAFFNLYAGQMYAKMNSK